MMNRPPSSYGLVWLSLTILILVALSFLFSIQPQDYWWCLRIGRDTLSTGAVPVRETLSWSQAGQPILYEPWLACVLLELTNDLGGAPLTFLLRGVLIGSTYGLLWLMVRRSLGPPLATALILVVGLASSNNWSMRAQLFAYPLFVFCLYSLLKWHQGNNKYLWGLPVGTMLWANLHGSFVLSLVLGGSAFIFGQGNRRQLLIVLVFMVLGTLITPHGLGLWTHLPFMLTVQSNQDYSLEWRPPVNEGWQMNIFFAWVLLFALMVGFSSRKLTLMEWLWFLGFGWLAFSGVRYVIWFLFLLAVLTARLLEHAIPAKLSQPETVKNPLADAVLSFLIVLLSLLFLPGIRETWWAQAPPAYDVKLTPIEAVEWLQEHPDLPGPLWNDYAFGSYLSYALPERPVSLDSRFFPFSGEQMEEYVRIRQGDPMWESVFRRDGINLLLLSTKTQPELVSVVQASPAWCEQYRDETAVIFSRCEPIP